MIVTIKKGASKESMKALLKKIYTKTTNGVDVKRFNGKVNFEKDALLIQNELRNEWN